MSPTVRYCTCGHAQQHHHTYTGPCNVTRLAHPDHAETLGRTIVRITCPCTTYTERHHTT